MRALSGTGADGTTFKGCVARRRRAHYFVENYFVLLSGQRRLRLDRRQAESGSLPARHKQLDHDLPHESLCSDSLLRIGLDGRTLGVLT